MEINKTVRKTKRIIGLAYKIIKRRRLTKNTAVISIEHKNYNDLYSNGGNNLFKHLEDKFYILISNKLIETHLYCKNLENIYELSFNKLISNKSLLKLSFCRGNIINDNSIKIMYIVQNKHSDIVKNGIIILEPGQNKIYTNNFFSAIYNDSPYKINIIANKIPISADEDFFHDEYIILINSK